MDATPFLTDGQYAGILAAIIGGLGAIATAVRWGLGRGARAFDDMASAFKALADKHQSTQETLVELRAEVREGRNDIGEIKTVILSVLEASPQRKSRRILTPVQPRRATTESDR